MSGLEICYTAFRQYKAKSIKVNSNFRFTILSSHAVEEIKKEYKCLCKSV